MGAGPIPLFGFEEAAHLTDSLVFGVGNAFYSAVLSRCGNDTLAGGAHGYIAELPADWNMAISMVGAQGINAAMYAWGAAARAQHALTRLTLDLDLLSSKLSYLENNGAYYCYCKLVGKKQIQNRTFPDGPAAPAHVVMDAVKKYHQRELRFELGVYYIDPYWYASHELWCGGTKDSGTCPSLNASAFHFPGGIASAVPGIPLQLYMTHSFQVYCGLSLSRLSLCAGLVASTRPAGCR